MGDPLRHVERERVKPSERRTAIRAARHRLKLALPAEVDEGPPLVDPPRVCAENDPDRCTSTCFERFAGRDVRCIFYANHDGDCSDGCLDWPRGTTTIRREDLR